MNQFFFLPRKCNYNKASNADGECSYGYGQYRKCCILYKVTYKICSAEYIENAQNHVKYRFARYYSKVQKLVHTGRKSDTFAENLAKYMTSEDPHTRDVRDIYKLIFLEGNPINLSKTFETRNRSLFLQEKPQIVCRSRKLTGGDFLNRTLEVEGACRHRKPFTGYG